MDGWIDGRMVELMDGLKDGRIDGIWMDGWLVTLNSVLGLDSP